MGAAYVVLEPGNDMRRALLHTKSEGGVQRFPIKGR